MPPELGGTPVEAERGQATADGDASTPLRCERGLSSRSPGTTRKSEQNQRWFKGLKVVPDRHRRGDPGGGRGLGARVADGRRRRADRRARGPAAAPAVPAELDQLPVDLRAAQAREVPLPRPRRPLRRGPDREALLAARVEGLVSQENAAWVSHQHEATTRSGRRSERGTERIGARAGTEGLHQLPARGHLRPRRAPVRLDGGAIRRPQRVHGRRPRAGDRLRRADHRRGLAPATC